MSDELRRHAPEALATVLEACLSQREVPRAALFYDLDLLEERLDYLGGLFPAGTLHAVAIKSQPMTDVLCAVVAAGHGLEAASFEEVELAAGVGCSPERIVFDSPVKTRDEIEQCARRFPGMVLNVNVLGELERIASNAPLRVGIRVNPKVASDAPSIYDVSNAASKFGVPIEQRDAIIDAAVNHPAVEGLHVHVGSELEDRGAIVAGARVLLDLAKAIEARGKSLTFIDIGGGVATRHQPGPQPGLAALVETLNAECPELARYQIVTEYGRLVHSHNGFAASRVEYVLEDRQPASLITHIGADLLLREIYSASPPHHEFRLTDPDGRLKRGAEAGYKVMGPLCFAGDQFPGEPSLPAAAEGDYLIIADCGANSIGMWSRHCSRQPPDWVTYRSGVQDLAFARRSLELPHW